MTTKILYKLDQKNNFQYFSIQGHVGYAEKGQDIVCAAISAITNGTVNFLQRYYGLGLHLKVSDAGRSLPWILSVQL